MDALKTVNDHEDLIHVAMAKEWMAARYEQSAVNNKTVCISFFGEVGNFYQKKLFLTKHWKKPLIKLLLIESEFLFSGS